MPWPRVSCSQRIPSAAEAGAEAIVPVHGGNGGHPVLLSPSLRNEIGNLDPETARLDLWLRKRKVDRLEVPFDCITANWNG